MNKHEAAYIIAEIRNLDRYQGMKESKEKEIASIRNRIGDMARPNTPNSGETIKPMIFNKDGSVKDMGEAFISRGHGKSQDTRLIELITDESIAENQLEQIRIRTAQVNGYVDQIKKQTDNDTFMIEFMAGQSYGILSDRYGYTNPYKRAIDILKKIDIVIF